MQLVSYSAPFPGLHHLSLCFPSFLLALNEVVTVSNRRWWSFSCTEPPLSWLHYWTPSLCLSCFPVSLNHELFCSLASPVPCTENVLAHYSSLFVQQKSKLTSWGVAVGHTEVSALLICGLLKGLSKPNSNSYNIFPFIQSFSLSTPHLWTLSLLLMYLCDDTTLISLIFNGRAKNGT